MLFLYVTYSTRLVVWNSDFFLAKSTNPKVILKILRSWGVIPEHQQPGYCSTLHKKSFVIRALFGFV